MPIQTNFFSIVGTEFALSIAMTSLNRLFSPYLLFFAFAGLFLLSIPQVSASVDCGKYLVQQFPHPIGPQLAIMNALADKHIIQIGKELNPVSRTIFFRQVSHMKAKDSVKGLGLTKTAGHQLNLNPLIIDHPIIRITLVHEAQHLADLGPLTPGILSAFIETLNFNHVKKSESRAFGREYDYIAELLQTPGFNAGAALAEFIRKPISEEDMRNIYWPKIKVDQPLFDDFSDLSPQFLRSPEKFYRDEGMRASLSNYFIRISADEFVSRIAMVKKMTKEQYINSRIEDYDKQIKRGKTLSFLSWGVSGLAASYCSLIAYFILK